MIKVIISNPGVCLSTDIYIVDEDESNKVVSVAKPIKLEFEPLNPDGMFTEPTIRFYSMYQAHQFLQSLAQALIDAGYRDKTISQSGEIKRMENHIQDLRRIIFEKPKC